MGATCGGDLTDDSTGLGLRIGAIFAIATVSTIGGLLPFIFRTARLSVLFHLGTLVAAGVVLGVGMVHVSPSSLCTAHRRPAAWLSCSVGVAKPEAEHKQTSLTALRTSLPLACLCLAVCLARRLTPGSILAFCSLVGWNDVKRDTC